MEYSLASVISKVGRILFFSPDPEGSRNLWRRTSLKVHGGNMGLARKLVAKVVLSKQQKEILTALSTRLGTSDSETLRMALMDYAKELNIINETLHHRKQCKKENDEK